MKKAIVILVLGLLVLTSCALPPPPSSSSKPVVSGNIRTIDLMQIGANKYSLYIRGNADAYQKALRKQFTQEVNGVCGSNFEILELEAGEVTHGSWKKPTLQGNFICK